LSGDGKEGLLPALAHANNKRAVVQMVLVQQYTWQQLQ
jgi:hypothetical protein